MLMLQLLFIHPFGVVLLFHFLLVAASIQAMNLMHSQI